MLESGLRPPVFFSIVPSERGPVIESACTG
jgi:hypothetical protein